MATFVCQECGAILPKWMGQCDVCKAWNCIIEEVSVNKKTRKQVNISEDFFVSLANYEYIRSDTANLQRHKTLLNEFNRVLGGGFVDGSVVLLGGPPGIGKSTILLQALSEISGVENFVYISAEESIKQVMMRAERLNINNAKLKVASSLDIQQILNSVNEMMGNGILVVDSIQTISSELVQSPPGSISQVRFCTQELVNFAKSNDVIVVIVGHITKDGIIAGPKTLEHMVDCVLYFEGDKSYNYRILRGEKNRYGPTDEIGVFLMTNSGLEEVSNPSSVFLSEYSSDVSGVAVFSGIEGTRPILSEVQALVSNTNMAIPKRSSVGFDANRLSMLVAVLSSCCKVDFSHKDIYVNIAGGLKVTEPAIDLAVIAAILSSAFKKPLPKEAIFFGEVNLSGEIRQANLPFPRIKEAQKLGFTKIFCPHKTDDFEKLGKLHVNKLKSIKEILALVKK
ncbi:MAG: DNA repair protein RadA [Holosporales bacterium]|jgi:DNA repair protein RadA/Sms|nr:DNA repair protein RadA [Holosporales bacterium]